MSLVNKRHVEEVYLEWKFAHMRPLREAPAGA